MSLVQVHTVIDQELIEQKIDERLDKACREVLLTWDTNEMSKRLCMSVRTIEDDFLKDDRMRALQRQKKGGKRYWFYEPSLKVIKQIMDEW